MAQDRPEPPAAPAPIPYLGIGKLDPQRDLRAISMTISIPLVLAVHPSLPARNIKELVALAKAKPGALTYSSSGPGASGHFTMELLNSATGIDTRHVAYRGAAPSLTSVISGETQMAFLVPPLVQAHAASGKLRPIAVSSRTRSSVFPDVPTARLLVDAYFSYRSKKGHVQETAKYVVVWTKVNGARKVLYDCYNLNTLDA